MKKMALLMRECEPGVIMRRWTEEVIKCEDYVVCTDYRMSDDEGALLDDWKHCPVFRIRVERPGVTWDGDPFDRFVTSLKVDATLHNVGSEEDLHHLLKEVLRNELGYMTPAEWTLETFFKDSTNG